MMEWYGTIKMDDPKPLCFLFFSATAFHHTSPSGGFSGVVKLIPSHQLGTTQTLTFSYSPVGLGENRNNKNEKTHAHD